MPHKPREWNRDQWTSRLVCKALAVLGLAGAGADEPVQMTRLASPDGRREVHGLYVIEANGDASAKIVIAEANGDGRRAVGVDALDSGHPKRAWKPLDWFRFSTIFSVKAAF